MTNSIDWNEVLHQHRLQHGAVYQLPDGSQVRLKPDEVAAYCAAHNLRLRVPSYQGDSIEDEQVGIKQG